MADIAYSVAADFGGVISSTCLTAEILASSITAVLDSITIVDDDVTITFDVSLTAGEQTTLDNIVATHDANCDDNQQQSDINTAPIILGTDGTANVGKFFEAQHNVGTNQSPVLTNRDITLSSITLASDSNQTGDIEIFKDGVLVKTFQMTNEAKKRENDLNISFEAGTEISAKVSSGSFTKPILTLWFKIKD